VKKVNAFRLCAAADLLLGVPAVSWHKRRVLMKAMSCPSSATLT
jgi:hypothetical protein